MRAIAINEFGGREKLELMDLPVPDPGEGEILVRANGAGVNPVDWKIREGWLKDAFPHEFPVILGWEVSGTVEKAGPGAERFEPGMEVYAYTRKPVIHDGSYAEYVTLDEANLAMKPGNASFEEAAAIPLACLTAWQSVFDAGKLQNNQSILVHAAAGGVGSFAVQLARNAGATVIGTASGRNHEYLKQLGTDYLIDYNTTRVDEAVAALFPEGVDLVLDCVGGSTLNESVKVVKKGGILASIVDAAAIKNIADQGVNAVHVFVEPDAEQLEKIARMVDNGQLNVHLDAVFPLEKAKQAHEKIETGHTRGKIVLRIKD